MNAVMVNDGKGLKPGEVDGTTALAEELEAADAGRTRPRLTRADMDEINARHGWTPAEAISQMRSGTYPGL